MSEFESAPDSAVLPPLEEVFGEDAVADVDLAAMLEIAFDPSTPDPDGDLVPDDGEVSSDVSLEDFADDATTDPSEAPEAYEGEVSEEPLPADDLAGQDDVDELPLVEDLPDLDEDFGEAPYDDGLSGL